MFGTLLGNLFGEKFTSAMGLLIGAYTTANAVQGFVHSDVLSTCVMGLGSIILLGSKDPKIVEAIRQSLTVKGG